MRFQAGRAGMVEGVPRWASRWSSGAARRGVGEGADRPGGCFSRSSTSRRRARSTATTSICCWRPSRTYRAINGRAGHVIHHQGEGVQPAERIRPDSTGIGPLRHRDRGPGSPSPGAPPSYTAVIGTMMVEAAKENAAVVGSPPPCPIGRALVTLPGVPGPFLDLRDRRVRGRRPSPAGLVRRWLPPVVADLLDLLPTLLRSWPRRLPCRSDRRLLHPRGGLVGDDGCVRTTASRLSPSSAGPEPRRRRPRGRGGAAPPPGDGRSPTTTRLAIATPGAPASAAALGQAALSTARESWFDEGGSVIRRRQHRPPRPSPASRGSSRRTASEARWSTHASSSPLPRG